MKTFLAWVLSGALTAVLPTVLVVAEIGGLGLMVVMFVIGLPLINWVVAKATGINLVKQYLR